MSETTEPKRKGDSVTLDDVTKWFSKHARVLIFLCTLLVGVGASALALSAKHDEAMRTIEMHAKDLAEANAELRAVKEQARQNRESLIELKVLMIEVKDILKRKLP